MSASVGMRRVNAVDNVVLRSARPSTLGAAVQRATRVQGRKGVTARLTVRAMFERFTEKAIKVVMLAQEEVRSSPPPPPQLLAPGPHPPLLRSIRG